MKQKEQNNIIIKSARLNNLKNVSLSIPKNEIVVFTGVSGSGKSSIVFDTIAVESQRQLNDTFSWYIRNRLPKYERPDVESIENLSPAIIINQKRMGGNSRSTVGTITDIQPMIRLLFSRAGEPSAGESNRYSFNDPAGMCPDCNGLGRAVALDFGKFIDMSKSLNSGALLFPPFRTGTWHWQQYANSGLFDNDKPLKDYLPEEINLLLYAKDINGNKVHEKWSKSKHVSQRQEYEGVIDRFNRIYMNRDMSGMSTRTNELVMRFVTEQPCHTCGGKRLNQAALHSKINGYNISDYSDMEVTDLYLLLADIHHPLGTPVASQIREYLKRIIDVGLGYLQLSRQTSTLSGGESQRLKMINHLGNSLTGMTYIFDEPSIGLHPRDIDMINNLFIRLRDKGNSVLIVEHDKDVMRIADTIVDMGPGAGENGGEVIYTGTYEGLTTSGTLTGSMLNRQLNMKEEVRNPKGWLNIANANLHNLKDVSVNIPEGVLVCVTGVAGSGKSTLISGVFMEEYPETVMIDQSAVTATIRSNPATYTGVFDEIRKLFAAENKVEAGMFSFNSAGACPVCKGKGVITTDMAFMDAVTTVCEHCNGKRYDPEILKYTYQGKSIVEVLQLTISQAIGLFSEKRFSTRLQVLNEVGLGYLTLGQSMDTLSGGELQRVKLASELYKKGNIYVMDEPTTGLHMADVGVLMQLINRLVDNGNTVIVIEHNTDVIKQADWIIDMGPDGGKNGGEVIFQGIPKDILHSDKSITARYLR